MSESIRGEYDILVLGAAFDPPHLGHLKMAETVLAKGLATEVVLMPCRQHPFAKQMLPQEQRLAMVEMLAGKGITVSEMELTRAGVSYTYLTLREMGKLYPGKRVGWLMGSDLVESFGKWENYQEILTDYGVLVYPRTGSKEVELLPGMKWIAGVSEIEISSSEVRARITQGKEWEGMVIVTVAEYIKQQGLYAREN
jgi:nicotinate-nucleotide adenylyltransferase